MILTGRDYYRSFVDFSVWTSTGLVPAQDDKNNRKADSWSGFHEDTSPIVLAVGAI